MIEELFEVRNKRSEDNKNKFQLKLDRLRKTEGNQAEIEQSVKDHQNQWNSSWEMMKRLEEAIHIQNLKIERMKKAKEEKLRKVEEEQLAKARQEQLLKAAQEEQLKKAQEEQLTKEEQEWGI